MSSPAPQQQQNAPSPQAYSPAPQAYSPAPQAYSPAPQAYSPAPQQSSQPSVTSPSPSAPVAAPTASPRTAPVANTPSNAPGVNQLTQIVEYEKRLLREGSQVFWGDNANVLFTNFEMFPSSDRGFNQNLNSVTRFIIILTIVMAIVTGRISVFFIGVITLFFIYLYHYFFSKKQSESFENSKTEQTKLEKLKAIQKMLFDKPTATNAFGNVLNSDIEGNPKKLPAPPVDDPKVQDAIFESAKQSMIINNPTFPDIDKKLLRNLGDVYEFEQSLQPFYTNPATTIPNDQNAFADFCYGSMISCKEGNLFACARNSEEASHYNKY